MYVLYSSGCEVHAALEHVWPQLQLGYTMIPGRPTKRLPDWKPDFIDVSSESEAGVSGGGVESPSPSGAAEFVGQLV